MSKGPRTVGSERFFHRRDAFGRTLTSSQLGVVIMYSLRTPPVLQGLVTLHC
jgi:hypothetical protein